MFGGSGRSERSVRGGIGEASGRHRAMRPSLRVILDMSLRSGSDSHRPRRQAGNKTQPHEVVSGLRARVRAVAGGCVESPSTNRTSRGNPVPASSCGRMRRSRRPFPGRPRPGPRAARSRLRARLYRRPALVVGHIYGCPSRGVPTGTGLRSHSSEVTAVAPITSLFARTRSGSDPISRSSRASFRSGLARPRAGSIARCTLVHEPSGAAW